MGVNFVKIQGSGDEAKDRELARQMYMKAAVPVMGRIADSLNLPRGKVMEWAAQGRWQKAREDLCISWREKIRKEEQEDYREALRLARKLKEKLDKRISGLHYDSIDYPAAFNSLMKFVDTVEKCHAKLKRRADLDREADQEEREIAE